MDSLSIDPAPLEESLARLIVQKYEGDLDDAGRYGGNGVATFTSGNKYEGEFKDGMMHGRGLFTWSDFLQTYEGDFSFNKIRGEGKYTWPDGRTYEGGVMDGVLEGHGTYTFEPQGENVKIVYKGEWENGKRHGRGTITYDVEGRNRYEGEWKEGKRHGEGVLVYPSGNKFVGKWENDEKEGHGVMYWFDRCEIYKGEWKKGVQSGQGEHVWLDQSNGDEKGGGSNSTQKQMCNRYKGEFVDGKREGKGCFFYANGAIYIGEWVGNQKHGEGKFTFEDGSVYEGPFQRDRMVNQKRNTAKPPPASTAPNGKGAANVSDESPGFSAGVEDLLRKDMNSSPSEAGYDASWAKAKKELDHVLLRVNTDLKHIYKYYSRVGKVQDDVLFTMNMRQLWRFLLECNVLTLAMPLATVNRIFFRMRRNAATNELLGLANANEAEVHNPNAPILYREFVEGLVRISSERYRNEDPRPCLSDSVLRMWADCVKDNALKENDDEFDMAFYSLEMSSVMETHAADLSKAFRTYAAGEGGGSDYTMTVREYVRLLRDCAVINNDCTVEDVVNLFTQFSDFDTTTNSAPTNPIEGGNITSEDSAGVNATGAAMPFVDIYDCELILPEFHEALARTAELKLGKGTEKQLHVATESFIKEYILPNAFLFESGCG